MRVFGPFALLVLLFPVLTGCSDSSVATGPTDASDVLVAATLESQVNAYRQSHGLGSLTDIALISGVALQHSQEMAMGRTPVGHDGFAARQSTICSAMPCGTLSENAGSASCQASPADALSSAFFASETHRRAILGSWTATGIGVASAVQGGCRVYYVTQLFYTPGV